MGPPGSMKTYGLRGASQEKGQKKITVRKEFPVFDKLFAKENKDLSSKKKEKGLWDESLDLFDLKAKGRKPLKVVNNLLNSTEGSLFSSANDTFDNFCSDGKFNQKVTDKVPSGVSIEISGHEQGSKNLVVHNSSENDSSLLCQSMFKHSLKNPPMQPVTEKKAWSNPWNESEALLISKNENCSDLMKHSSEVLVDSRKESEQTLPWKSHLLLANRQRLNTSRRCGERRSSRKSVSQIGALPGKSVSKAVLDPKQHVLELCGQKNPVSIQECLTSSRLKCCKKIGEGAFGEVFMTRPDPNSMDGAAVLKIMPIEGNFKVNGENQKTFGEIVSEIIISKELSGLRESNEGRNCCENFVHVLSSWCVFGSYLPSLLDMWDQFDTEKGSENDRPDLFPDTQLYIILEFGHGGQDLESFVFNNAGQAVAIFLQIAYSLAVSEQELEFEHRDLHWGNVLVAVSSAKVMEFRIAGKTYKLKTQGVKATVIDFTLSRLQAPDCVVFNNLSQDPELFESEGDYQFEVYRLMKKATKNDWEKFNPYTNVLWLHYILDKMETECYYKNVKTKVHQTNLKEIRQLKSSMLDYRSATDFVLKREE
ncbi:haspin isoform X2 [Oratosquilla oratoria]|uniref:haspin isoform X2 n=1 Tax=Oratosquilla oratoria TaxID=337810 RepID=UPI003F770410